MFEPVTDFLSFSTRAVDWFRSGDVGTKRLVLQTTGSNLRLTDKLLRIDTRKPFFRVSGSRSSSDLLAVAKDVRTSMLSEDPEFTQTLGNVRDLMRMYGEPLASVPNKESRRKKAA